MDVISKRRNRALLAGKICLQIHITKKKVDSECRSCEIFKSNLLPKYCVVSRSTISLKCHGNSFLLGSSTSYFILFLLSKWKFKVQQIVTCLATSSVSLEEQCFQHWPAHPWLLTRNPRTFTHFFFLQESMEGNSNSFPSISTPLHMKLTWLS